MATTSLSLGGHWETFIKGEIQSGLYASANEVVRAALRELEDRSKRLEILRAHLAEGATQAARRNFVDDFSIDDVIERATARV